jgi:hypothetical protein
MSDAQPTMDQPAVARNGDVPLTAAFAGSQPERPELIVGAAFAGGLALALLLKRLAR